MINVIFNDFDYEITQKKKEIFDKYNKVIQWGRRHPVKFMELYFGLEFTDHQKYILLSTWTTKTSVWLMSRNSGKAIDLEEKVWMEDNTWKYMKDIKVGDYVLDYLHNPTKVIAKSDIQMNDCYKVYFSDGEIILASDNHTWSVRKNDELYYFLIDTKTLYEILKYDDKIYNIDEKQIIGVERCATVPTQCIEVDNLTHTYLCGEKMTATHNSYLSAPYMMARSILIPNHHTYIMCPAGNQAQETFGKMEDLAKGNIQSIAGATKVFWNELVKSTNGSDGFIHDKTSYHCELYNGSSISTLNSVAKNIVGIRSNLNFYDEAGKVDRDYFALTEPFCTQNTNFITGKNLNIDCYPQQLPNQIIYSSSAESMDSQLYDQYKLCALNMIAGDPDYFACDITCELSLHPMKDGKPYTPLLDQSKVDDALKKNEYRANREYFNKFDLSGGQDALVKRTTIIANSFAYHPVFENLDNESIFIITYDPSTKLDNSFVLISQLLFDEEKGYMLKIVAGFNLIEITATGDKKVIQKPEQIEIIKELILKYNGAVPDYENLGRIIIDAGSGGGGFDIAQFLLKDWHGPDGMRHLGLIDLQDKYLQLERDKFPAAIDKLTMANFTSNKVQMYTDTQDMINQGLVMLPKSLNLRCEMEFERVDGEGNVIFDYEPMSDEEIAVLTEIDLLKEELVAMQKLKQGTNVKFDIMPSKKAQNMHDDRADCCAMACHFLANLRREKMLDVGQKKKEGFNKYFSHVKSNLNNGGNNPFKNTPNPFDNVGPNPFLNS